MKLANTYQKHPITGEMIPPGWFYEGEEMEEEKEQKVEESNTEEGKEAKGTKEEKTEGGTKEKTVKKE